jgi:DNA-binding NarL/FixJ family response regulator
LTESSAQGQIALSSRGSAKIAGIRVLLADDHVLLRQSLRLLLDMHEEILVIGEVDSGREAVEVACGQNADVVLMDVRMPDLNGIEATRQIRARSPHTRVLMLTGISEYDQIVEALRAGASGYVVKQSDAKELVIAIQSVYRGNTYFSGSLNSVAPATELLLAAQKPATEQADPLTAREREVLQLAAEGKSNQSIADDLVLSVKTVEAHKAHIMAKLRFQSQTDLIRYALRRGIIGLDTGDGDER